MRNSSSRDSILSCEFIVWKCPCSLYLPLYRPREPSTYVFMNHKIRRIIIPIKNVNNNNKSHSTRSIYYLFESLELAMHYQQFYQRKTQCVYWICLAVVFVSTFNFCFDVLFSPIFLNDEHIITSAYFLFGVSSLLHLSYLTSFFIWWKTRKRKTSDWLWSWMSVRFC